MWERLDRRSFVRELGVASFGIVILGTAACSATDPDDASETPSPPGTRTTGESLGAPEPTGLGSGGTWHRASFGFVSAYVMVAEGVATLVDSGMGDVGPITDALDTAGVGWSAVADVILTHKHNDHVGGLANVRTGNDAARVHAGAEDIDAIGAADLLAASDADVINGLRIIATPGHTPGHISVLDEASGVLVAGDALNGADGGVVGPNADFSEDMEAANASVQVLAGYDYDTILFGHGEPVTSNGSAQVQALLG